MEAEGELQQRVRLAAFRFLDDLVSREGEVLSWASLTKDFEFDGRRVPLMGATGIWTPAGLGAAISITTAPSRPGQPPPYEDSVGDDGLLEYRYRGTDPANHDNRALRRAFRERLPLVYFLGIDKGRYRPFWPVFIEHDEPDLLRVRASIQDAASTGVGLGSTTVGADRLDRLYARRVTLQRLHQAAFRERVMAAYRSCCAICRLRHLELLDAAHIVGDGHPRGDPVVPNGLALCKIHHAAFDRNILGIRPDRTIEVRDDVLAERDGPMLQHGIKEFHGVVLQPARRAHEQPDPELLEIRYAEFRAAS